MKRSPTGIKPWHQLLEEEDLQFIRRFLLASGSLKELAAQYEVTYPTIRLRLDRLIEKIKLMESLTLADEFELSLRTAYADGKIEKSAFEQLLKHYLNLKTKEQE